MWTSSQTKATRSRPDSAAALGTVTSGGPEVGVFLGAERRRLPILAPGGYRWRPSVGDQVLVLKTGADGQSPFVLAGLQPVQDDLMPGEVELAGPGCSLRLDGSGSVILSGTVMVNGLALEELIRTIAAQQLAAQISQEE